MKKSIFAAIIIAVIATLWIMSGLNDKTATNNDSGNDNSFEQQAEANLTPNVQVKDLRAEILKDTVNITGRSQAARQVMVSAEISGQIANLMVDKGDFVKKGDILAKIEIKDRAAKVTEAEQLIEQRRIQLNAAEKLSDRGFTSNVRLAESRAELEKARAQLKQAKIELGETVIRAPFDGVINNKMIEIGDFVTNGTPLVDLVDLNPIKITGFLTEKQLVRIEEGSKAHITFLDGREIDGTITFIASAADPQTRTFTFEVTAPNDKLELKEGLTAKISVPTKQVDAYRISPSILSLADDGTVGVKIVSPENIIRFVPIRLLKDTKDFLWVGGLPSEIRLVTVGQEFVMPGQEVNPVVESDRSP